MDNFNAIMMEEIIKIETEWEDFMDVCNSAKYAALVKLDERYEAEEMRADLEEEDWRCFLEITSDESVRAAKNWLAIEEGLRELEEDFIATGAL